MTWEEYFSLWKESEAIAIHFNQLLITLRTQALGGVAATVAILVGLLAHRKTSDTDEDVAELTNTTNWSALAASFFFLSMLWFSLSALDLQYYHKLLDGSVQGILEIEKRSINFGENSTVKISHHIRYAVDPKEENIPDTAHMLQPANSFESTPAVNWFYGTVLFTLLCGFSFSASRRLFDSELCCRRKFLDRCIRSAVLPVVISAAVFTIFWTTIAT